VLRNLAGEPEAKRELLKDKTLQTLGNSDIALTAIIDNFGFKSHVVMWQCIVRLMASPRTPAEVKVHIASLIERLCRVRADRDKILSTTTIRQSIGVMIKMVDEEDVVDAGNSLQRMITGKKDSNNNGTVVASTATAASGNGHKRASLSTTPAKAASSPNSGSASAAASSPSSGHTQTSASTSSPSSGNDEKKRGSGTGASGGTGGNKRASLTLTTRPPAASTTAGTDSVKGTIALDDVKGTLPDGRTIASSSTTTTAAAATGTESKSGGKKHEKKPSFLSRFAWRRSSPNKEPDGISIDHFHPSILFLILFPSFVI
jgi:hypothetical protein